MLTSSELHTQAYSFSVPGLCALIDFVFPLHPRCPCPYEFRMGKGHRLLREIGPWMSMSSEPAARSRKLPGLRATGIDFVFHFTLAVHVLTNYEWKGSSIFTRIGYR
jgi:hypothetical protein